MFGKKHRIAYCCLISMTTVLLGSKCGNYTPPGDADPLLRPGSGPPLSARHPNVILIVADDLGWADVGYHGSEIETPNIDRLANEGVRLERFYVSPICTPTRYAIMTGKSPIHIGWVYHVIRPWSPRGLPEEEYTIAERFHDAGYQTALLGKWHLGHNKVEYWPNNHGFDYYYGTLYGQLDYFTHRVHVNGLSYIDWQRNGETVHEKGYITTLLGIDAVRYIRERDTGRPFFVILAFQSPHAPNMTQKYLINKYSDVFPGGRNKERRVHAAMVDALDQSVGMVLNAIDTEGIADNTIVMFMSDNGGLASKGASNDPLRGGKGTTWEGGIRVPAVIRWPGHLPTGAISQQLMRDYDLFPTFASAAGLNPLGAPAEGMNVWPVLEGAPEQKREPFFFASEGSTQKYGGVIDWPWKLVSIRKRITYLGKSFMHTSIYLMNLASDPLEQQGLVQQLIQERMLDSLARWEGLYPEDGIRFASESKRKGWNWKSPKEEMTEIATRKPQLQPSYVTLSSPFAPVTNFSDTKKRCYWMEGNRSMLNIGTRFLALDCKTYFDLYLEKR